MWFDHNRDGQKRGHVVNAAVIASESQFMLQKLSLPIEPTDSVKARMLRATRRAGLSPRKATRIWYRHPCAILAHEYAQLKQAYRTHIETQETRLEAELAYLRELQARELQHEFGLTDAEARHDAVDAA